MSKPRRGRRPAITVEQVIQASGVDRRIISFAVFNGYTLGSSDMSLDEQAARIRRLNPEMDDEDVLVMLGECLASDVAEFFDTAFPVVRHQRAG